DHGSRGCRTEAQALGVDGDANQLGDAFDVDEGGRLRQTRTKLHEEISASREHSCFWIGFDQTHGLSDRLGGFVSYRLHQLEFYLFRGVRGYRPWLGSSRWREPTMASLEQLSRGGTYSACALVALP